MVRCPEEGEGETAFIDQRAVAAGKNLSEQPICIIQLRAVQEQAPVSSHWGTHRGRPRGRTLRGTGLSIHPCEQNVVQLVTWQQKVTW